ncbi:hypothetical protein [Pseudodesulfovibrio methanolicus]|uniref:MarR family transcriptional regulator n=1 Tax=Pseudodesulfovibrio methanolicus TaxID=3126690 RepID=A0ABZ2IXI6_9BACT
MLKLTVLAGQEWTYGSIAYELGLSSSVVHSAVKRAIQAQLFNEHERRPRFKALEEFLIHGVKYAFVPDVGSLTRGIPTAFAAPVFRGEFGSFDEDMNIYVWPHPRGEHRGMGLSPLHKSVPEAVERDQALHDALAVLDALRIGRAREQRFAENILREMLHHAKAQVSIC